MSNIIEQLRWRYATKKFDTNKKLSPAKIDILKQAFNLTATSFGLQTLTLVVVSNGDLKSALVPYSYNQKQVAEASQLLVICIQDDISDLDVVNYYNNIKTTRKTPDEILQPYRNDLINMIQNMTIEERQQWSLNQAHIVLGNLMTVCAIEGIDSCPMEGFIAEKYDDILNLKVKGLKSVLLLPVGYRAEGDMFAGFKKVRKPLDETIIEFN